MYIITHIYIEDMRTKVSECAVTFERSVLGKIANSNFVPTLRGFRWYTFFCGSGTVSGIRGKQMTPAVASERSVFSKNHDYIKCITSKKSFPCRCEHVRIYLYFGVQMHVVAENYEQTRAHTHTHTRDNHSNDNNEKH